MASRSTLSLNICASSERICRCFSVAFSGTRSTKTSVTALPSGASNGTGWGTRTNAPRAPFSPLVRPCGMATPWPRPVGPRRSRANRLSNTTLRAIACWFSKRSPTCSNRRFLLDTCMSRTTSAGFRSLATRVMAREGGASYLLSCSFVVALVLVAQHLAVELVGEEIDGGVEVGVLALAVQRSEEHTSELQSH